MTQTVDRRPTVAVIILNWNGVSMLRTYLPRVLATTPADVAEVIVADNGSTDDSLEVLSSEFPGVRVIALDSNYGFAEGYNRAIDIVDHDYVVLLNSDVEPADGWIEPLVDFMESHADCGACQPKILSVEHRGDFEYAGAAGGFLDRNGYPYCRGRIFDTVEPDNGQYDTSITVDWASGAALMVHRTLYRAVGGMDKDFFAHMEEIDLCWRIRLAGYKVACCTASAVYHLGGGTLPQGNPRKTYLNFRNNLLLLHKNLPDGVRGRRLFVRRLYDTLAWFKFVVSRQWADAAAVLRAHRDFRRMRRRYRVHPDVNLLSSTPNIIVDYYLRGRRTYSDLNR